MVSIGGTFEISDSEITSNTATSNSGGGIYADIGGDGSVTATNLILKENNALSGSGGGIYATDNLASFTMIGGTFSNNKAKNGGAVAVNTKSGANPLLKEVTISNNDATENGGGVQVTTGKYLTIEDCTISENTAAGEGGGIYAPGKLTFTSGTVTGNSAKNGGGIFSSSASSHLTMEGGTISGNTATENGAGIYNGGTLKFSAGTVSSNTAGGAGGGIYNSGALFMYGSAIIGDSLKTTTATDASYSNKGDGINSIGTVYLGYSDATTEASLTGGVFYNNGVGISNTNGTVIMKSGNISYNSARGVYLGSNAYEKYGPFMMNGGTINGNGNTSEAGGAVYCGYHGKFTMYDGEISGNTASNGGGVCITNDLSSFIMTGGTISGNTAAANGGGVYIERNSFTMTDGTISGNKATSDGGGIYIASTATCEMTGGTVSENTAANGGGAYVNGTFKAGGAALVNGGASKKNDIYLVTGYSLCLTSNLTAESAYKGIFTPSAYTEGIALLTQSDSGTDLIATNYGKFEVTPNSEENWVLDENGKLAK